MALLPRPLPFLSPSSPPPPFSPSPASLRRRLQPPSTPILHRPSTPPRRRFLLRSTQNGTKTQPDSESEPTPAAQPIPSDPPNGGAENPSELGKELNTAIKERETGRDSGLLSGVAEEIGEIEWPAFQKVLGTTGVVLGVIAGSSVVLLTVNGVLAEISDRVFAGKGIQDFFSG